MTTLQQLFPDAQPEELGGALLEILDGRAAPFSQNDFIGPISRAWSPQWPQEKAYPIQYAIAEALAWLERAGLIMDDFRHTPPAYRILTRRGRELRSREQAKVYRDAAVLPEGLVHPEILPKAHPPFLRGDYEVAVFAAMRAVEVAVRKTGGYADEELGVFPHAQGVP